MSDFLQASHELGTYEEASLDRAQDKPDRQQGSFRVDADVSYYDAPPHLCAIHISYLRAPVLPGRWTTHELDAGQIEARSYTGDEQVRRDLQADVS